MTPRAYRRTLLDRVMDTTLLLAVGGIAGIAVWAVIVLGLSVVVEMQGETRPALVAQIRATVP